MPPTIVAPRFRTSGIRILLGVSASVLCASAAAALDVVETHPVAHSLSVAPAIGEIWARFDGVPAVPAGAVRVAGVSSGLRGATASVSGDTLKITLDAGSFFVGEQVTVGLRNTISGASGSLDGGYWFSFTVAAGASAAIWSAPLSYGAARIPYFIYSGDLDGDGTADMAVPNEGTSDVSVFLNSSGIGVFSARDDHPVGSKPSSICGEDFDNDGDQDLATADIIGGSVSVLLNNGDGTYAPAVSYAAGGFNTECRQVHGADFDGDGDIDLAATSRATNEVYIYRGQGDGSFSAGVPYTNVGAGPFALHTGDFDLDGHVDIGVACQTADRLYVLLNDGLGQFTTLGNYTIGDGPWDLVGNDMDGDGDLDLVAVNSFANQLVVLRNNGTGAYTTRILVPTSSFPLAVHVADLDGDGDIDATSSNFNAGNVNVFRNPGNGSLAFDVSLDVSRTGSYAWANDLDGDGDLDLTVVDEIADSLYVFYNGAVPSDAPKPEDPKSIPFAQDLVVAPNPMPIAAGTTLYLQHAHAPITVTVFGVDGRQVRALGGGRIDARGYAIDWDGLDESGRRVAPGRYYVSAVLDDGRRVARELLAIE